MAKNGLDVFKAKVGAKATMFGFVDGEEVNQVTLGAGHQLHYVDPDKLRNASGDSLLDLVTPAQAWLYAVNVEGVSKGQLIIAFLEGRYQLVQLGRWPWKGAPRPSARLDVVESIRQDLGLSRCLPRTI